ncbi:MAG: hypothetical protein ABIJ56_11415 [Pseudomonadota bacterium]
MAEKRAWLAACIAWLLPVTCGCSLSVPSKFSQDDPTNDFEDASDGDEFVLDQFVPDIDFDIYDVPFSDDGGPPDMPPDHGPEVIDTVEDDPSTTCNPADCPLGCHATEPRCNRLNPSNYDPIPFHDAIDGGLAIPGGESIHVNTDDGSIKGSIEYRPPGSPGGVLNGIYWNIVDQPGGLPIAVFGMKSLDLPAGAIMHVAGGHAAAFYIRDNANISGIIEARAGGRQGGAGGGMGGEKNGANGDPCGDDSHGKGGGQDGSGDDQIEAGGGGGGSGGTGGNGGNAVYSTYLFGPGGAGGNAVMGESLVPLSGGCGGGAGGGPDTAGNSYRGGDGGYGGGGGGAIQISAGGSISISMGAGINVPGAGGQGGLYGAGGGGGGAGGGVLLEAATISNAGLLAANGGGGGAGGAHTEWPEGEGGMDGGFDTLLALGESAIPMPATAATAAAADRSTAFQPRTTSMPAGAAARPAGSA